MHIKPLLVRSERRKIKKNCQKRKIDCQEKERFSEISTTCFLKQDSLKQDLKKLCIEISIKLMNKSITGKFAQAYP